jgi:predicted glycoside hydrolase/deacetylase ChbG (UPF0249 family)
MSAHLVICADDFGMNPAVSQGIAQLAAHSRLSATSAMILAPGWPTDVALLRPLRQQLDVGLHLDWTSPFAIDAGHGKPLSRLMLQTQLRQLDRRQTREVIERQFDLFEAHWQAPPDHVDGHQHVQQFPVIRDALIEVLTQRYPEGSRPWLRISRPLVPSGDIKAWVIGAMGAQALQGLARQAKVPHSQWLNGIYGFEGDSKAYGERLTTWLQDAAAHPGVVMMCHPGLPSQDADDPIAHARMQELQVLEGTRLPSLLQRHGLQLVRGRQAWPAHPIDTPSAP